jgi:hypothetical protein
MAHRWSSRSHAERFRGGGHRRGVVLADRARGPCGYAALGGHFRVDPGCARAVWTMMSPMIVVPPPSGDCAALFPSPNGEV